MKWRVLSIILVFCLVISILPLSAAAAKVPSLNKTSKTLYINENECGSSFDFNVKNKIAAARYSWFSSNEKIATVNKKTGVVTAGKQTGRAAITCKMLYAGNKTKTLKALVTVKENAASVEISNPPEDNQIFLTSDVAYDFNSKTTSASGAKATDYRFWRIIDGSDVATVDGKYGKVTALRTGTFTIQVIAYQNKAKLDAGDVVKSEPLTVHVVDGKLRAKALSQSSVSVQFDSGATVPTDSAAYTIADSNGNDVGVSSVAQTADNTASLTLAEALVSGQFYTLKVGGSAVFFAYTAEQQQPRELHDLTITLSQPQEGQAISDQSLTVSATYLDNGTTVTVPADSLELEAFWISSTGNPPDETAFIGGAKYYLALAYNQAQYQITKNTVATVNENTVPLTLAEEFWQIEFTAAKKIGTPSMGNFILDNDGSFLLGSQADIWAGTGVNTLELLKVIKAELPLDDSNTDLFGGGVTLLTQLGESKSFSLSLFESGAEFNESGAKFNSEITTLISPGEKDSSSVTLPFSVFSGGQNGEISELAVILEAGAEGNLLSFGTMTVTEDAALTVSGTENANLNGQTLFLDCTATLESGVALNSGGGVLTCELAHSDSRLVIGALTGDSGTIAADLLSEGAQVTVDPSYVKKISLSAAEGLDVLQTLDADGNYIYTAAAAGLNPPTAGETDQLKPPATGDSANLVLYIFVCAVCGLFICLPIRKKCFHR